MAEKTTAWDKARQCGGWIMFACNLLMFVVFVFAYSVHAVTFGGDPTKWDGPTVASLVLTAAALVMAGLTLMVGIVAIWGYSTLKAEAEKIAERVALEAIEARQKQDILNKISLPNTDGEDISSGYNREERGG
ncbi:hypothetical protein [Acetobacter malorum]|uniref:Uncharacterized protein n=1 Tax=Acetobacter malorum TaxID=178901 RepID=A0A1Y3G763_9PROT|nr:hypothetical protein [Acetobacter malorum]OUJ06672.1 hypothetical protein HK23_14490 [Acetobacter malorum]